MNLIHDGVVDNLVVKSSPGDLVVKSSPGFLNSDNMIEMVRYQQKTKNFYYLSSRRWLECWRHGSYEACAASSCMCLV